MIKKSIFTFVLLCFILLAFNSQSSYVYGADPQWVLVNIIDYPNTEGFNLANKSEVYHTQSTYSRGGLMVR